MLKLGEEDKAEIMDFVFGDEQEDGWGGLPMLPSRRTPWTSSTSR